MKMKEQADQIVRELSLEEEIRLFAVKNGQVIEGIPKEHILDVAYAELFSEVNMEKATMSVYPDNHITIFPSQSQLACSFDENLLEDIGKALAKEYRSRGISLVLGPNTAVKRSPLNAYGEQYFSEDPYVTGKMSAALVKGLQAEGVSTCITSFVTDTMTGNSMGYHVRMDDRAFYEIYAKPFEIVVKEAFPRAIQCSYAKMNGISMCENQTIIKKLLRDEWKFEGTVFSSPGAVRDAVSAITAGTELTFSGSNKSYEKEIKKALEEGELTKRDLNMMARDVISLLLSSQTMEKDELSYTQEPGESLNREYSYDRSAHRKLSWVAAQESAVLLKNNGILPLEAKKNIAVIGEMALYPRYSSNSVNLSKDDECASVYQVLNEYGYSFGYAKGYSLCSEEVDEDLIREALKMTDGRDVVLIFAGVPDSQRMDKDAMLLPKNQRALIDAILAAQKKVILFVFQDNVVRIPRIDELSAVLFMGIGGEQVGRACVNLLSGRANPCGKLAESIPLTAKDLSCYHYLKSFGQLEEYRESILLGYRYFDTAGKKVQFPFGYGLSYTTFSYGTITCECKDVDFFQNPDTRIVVTIPITNMGHMDGKEIVQLYLSQKDATIFRPKQELKRFQKVFIKAGETKEVTFTLARDAFTYYSILQKGFAVINGTYEIRVGSSSRNILAIHEIQVTGVDKTRRNLIPSENKNWKEVFPTYGNLKDGELVVPREEFYKLFTSSYFERKTEKHVMLDTPLRELQATFWGRLFVRQVIKRFETYLADVSYPKSCQRYAESAEELLDMPMDIAAVVFARMNRKKVHGFVECCNHRYITGVSEIIFG